MSNGHGPKSTMETYENTPLTAPNYANQGRPTFGQKLKNHLRRFWWLHLSVIIVVGLLITLLLIFVAYPRIAQNGVSGAKLEILNQTVRNPTPESVDIELWTEAESSSAFHPTLDPFNASLYLPDQGVNNAFGILLIPSLKATKDTIVHVNQTMQILNEDQFVLYNMRSLVNESYEVAMAGRTALHLGSFPVTHVNFDKTITVNGLNGFKGFEILNFNISLQAQPDGTNMVGNVLLPNPSNMTLALGNVTLNVAVDGQMIGTSTLSNVVLKPGNNILPMRSVTDQSTVLGLITSKYKNGILPITISGNTTTYNGKQLPYFEDALRVNVLNTTLDVGKALAAIGINITALTGSGSSSGSSSSSASSSSTTSGGLFGATSSSSAAPLFGASSSSSASASASSSSSGGLFGSTTSSAALLGATSSSATLEALPSTI